MNGNGKWYFHKESSLKNYFQIMSVNLCGRKRSFDINIDVLVCMHVFVCVLVLSLFEFTSICDKAIE